MPSISGNPGDTGSITIPMSAVVSMELSVDPGIEYFTAGGEHEMVMGHQSTELTIRAVLTNTGAILTQFRDAPTLPVVPAEAAISRKFKFDE